MKVLLASLVVVFIALQYRLWFDDGSVQEVWRLNQQGKQAKSELLQLRGRNQALEAEVADLKSGLEAIEERARSQLGMIDDDETFYQFVNEGRASATVNTMELAIPVETEGRMLIDRRGLSPNSQATPNQ